LTGFLLLLASFFVSAWITRKQTCLDPYSKTLLRPGYTLPAYTMELMLRFLYSMHQYDNRMFDPRKAAFCRATGRLYPNALKWMDVINVDWSFLRKRYPGNWVSWGSLTNLQQEAMRSAHHHLNGYQTMHSSMNHSPKAVEQDYVYMKPGPLYVDLDTRVLLGWKCVPDTELEVLVVQKPKGIFELPKG